MEQFFETFFSWPNFKDSIPSVIEGFTHIDLFRAIPGIVLIYMVGFGIPISGVPSSAPGPSTPWPCWP
jgi:hypothetical protein